VLHVINQLSPLAGAEVSLREFILASGGSGVEHEVAVLKADNNILGPLLDARIRVAVPATELTSRVDGVRHVTAAIRRCEPHLLHTSLFEADLAGRLAGYRTRTPVLTSLVSTPYGEVARAAEPAGERKLAAVQHLERFLAQHATTAFHAISSAAAIHAAEKLGIRPDRIRVVPRGRSAETLGTRSAARRSRVRSLESWRDRCVVVNVARQEPAKGQIHLLDAWPIVRSSVPDALLVIVGREGRSTAAIQGRIRRLGIDDSVRFLGVRTDVPDLVAAADVFAFSSLYEGLGGAVIEAAGIGTPVVTSDLPAIREVLGENHPWLVPPADPTSFARAIVEALGQPGRAEQIGAVQRQRFLERFELSVVVDRMLSMYADLVEGVATSSTTTAVHRVPRLLAWK
jgi:glycosyltransferase involved in cell wall biosynthesis